jgi:sensor histidine kinase regulating citrate/malate metabolism
MGIRMVYTTLAAREQREKSQALQNQLAIAKNQYAMLNENIAQIRRLRHDMKYHIGVIYGLLQQEDYEQLRVYMRQYYDQLTLLDTSLPIYTQNQTVNILAVYYARQAEEKGIAWQMDFSIPEHLPFDQAHLTVLLGNMWRNALDACEVLPEDTSRFVSTRICIDGNKLIIKCRNSTPSVEIDENGRLVSTKGEGHGTGLSSMEAIIAEHNGFSSIKSENGIFTFAAALEIK